jgi:L-amino acid N-acyltransferase YncA
MVREMRLEDAEHVLAVYKSGIETGNATFEIKVPSWEEWSKKHLQHSRFVFTENDKVIGWSALSPVSARKVYEGVAEISIYVDPEHSKKGIGSQLMERIISSSEQHGIWTLSASVFPENLSTLHLHAKYGFRIVGTRERIAELHGKWRDTILLERRSKLTGV